MSKQRTCKLLTKILLKTCSSLVKMISDLVNNFVCKINAIRGWSIETYYPITKSDNMGSPTVNLHGINMIDMQIQDWLWKHIFILYKTHKYVTSFIGNIIKWTQE